MDLQHRQLVLTIPRLSAPFCHLLLDKINAMKTSILLYKTSVISIMVGQFDCKYRCHVENNVPNAFLPSNLDGKMVLQIQGWKRQAVYAYGQTINCFHCLRLVEPWSSLVQGDEGCLGPMGVLLCLSQIKKICSTWMTSFYTWLTIGLIQLFISSTQELHSQTFDID